MKYHISFIKNDSRHWSLFMCAGALFIVSGVYIAFFPFTRQWPVAHLFGFLALLAGIWKITFSAAKRGFVKRWKWHFAVGVSDMVAGAFLLVYQGYSSFIWPFLLGFWILAGIVTLFAELSDVNMMKATESEWLVAGAMLTILSPVLVTVLPVLGVVTTILWITVFLVVTGLFFIYLAIRLRHIKIRYRL
ncbi:HdeD family acid-resistance protein [Foetidibacter luteolus]|uniref:HdeD family acid-resistance protein n=1 Tax=Foetidibacter luteolus TaxID=2608880 RepID=UPI001A981C96|nr:DUF308 domain-containing protein [Foetidibacter luteolus]